MTHSPADVTAVLLAALGIGSDPTGAITDVWPVYAGDEPDKPDNCVTVYDRGAPNQGRINPTGEVAGNDGIQIRVRSATHATGWDKSQQICDALTLRNSVYRTLVTMPGGATYRVHAYVNVDSPLPLGKDTPGSKRRLFTINCEVVLSEE